MYAKINWTHLDWTAIGTIALALVTVWLALETHRVVNETRKEAGVANVALAAAQQQALEAQRARIDARAPSVVVVVLKPGWPPLAPPDPSVTDAVDVELNLAQEFHLPVDRSKQVWFKTEAMIRNDGQSTAIVTFSSVSRLRLKGAADRPTSLGDDMFLLRPGGEGAFELYSFRTVADYAEAWSRRAEDPPSGSSRVTIEVIVRDTFDNGIADNIFIEVEGYPLRPDPNRDGVWGLWNESLGPYPAPVAAAARPAHRRYWVSKRESVELPIATDRASTGEP